MSKKECVAMLLAGGEGRRLAPLTTTMAKPAVPFGGQYRIIDFPLSNCVNSNIDTVGVLTQYEANSLHQHIGSGEPWGLHSKPDQGVRLLPSGVDGRNTYTGTADAIYKNIDFIDSQNPEHVLILSADHIYHMDYRKMLDYHISKAAKATISVMEVPWDEASRFGVMNVNEELKISEFAEKPKVPKSNLASMGIYLFEWAYLKEYLLLDAADSSSSHDFGKDVIPAMLDSNDDLFAYRFQGYWRDVGTVDSLWEAHMDLLQADNGFKLDNAQWPMYSRARRTKPAAVKPRIPVQADDCLVNEACLLEGSLQRSVIFGGVEIGKLSRVHQSIVMPGVQIGRGVLIENAIIGEGAVIKDGAVIKGSPDNVVVVGPNEIVAAKPVIRTQPSRLLQEVYEKTGRLRAEGLPS
ncbi:glucose-1-phosphate adenylyltransferase [Paenibacillus sp. FSL R7-0273]|uniref:glucose-1-phosphate adenylyltransferase n=1 Tax=Paenibacillus sp. FSL R7-0273 TaxID=1536772 RepID=UPI0004F7134C|nr:glucose-1-phosphate adenylyltransferase [Paenibacillus sp. FSL R7-0273]AIQ47571.1 glucose-1-phosphate adenylyltransferase [Paenibacillus sp. FSL R7-0273]OMF95874.1 glucose-1-phosphate adenylyltransferase [Paenibacillus sp. FSL R7-0273]